MDRGFIRKSRKGGEYDLDELDAFADTTDEVDVTEMGLKVKPVTASSLADAEDLRAFLEAERRRKLLFGSDDEVKEEVVVQNQESEVVEHEIVDLVSEDELNNWDADESSVVIIKQKESNVPSFTSNFRSSSFPKAEPGTLRKSPRKSNRVSCSDLPCEDQPPTFFKIPDDNEVVVKHKSPRQSSSRSQKPRPSPKFRVFVDIVRKRDDSSISSSPSNLRSPSISQAKSKTRNPRRRNCVSSDPNDLPSLSPTVYKISDNKAVKRLDNKVVKRSSSRSQGIQPSPELSVSSDIVHKRDDRGIPCSTSNLRTPSIPRAKSEILRRSPRKRNRVSFDSDDLPYLNQPPTVYESPDIDDNLVKRKSLQRSRSQGLRPSPNLSVSSAVVHRQDDSGIPSSSNLRTPSILQAKLETLQRNPRKRNRITFDSDDLPCLEQPPTVYEILDNRVVKHKSLSSRSQRPRPSPGLSVSCSESESGCSSSSEQEYNHEPPRSHYNNFQFPYHYPYPQHHRFYPPSPHRNQQQQEQEQHLPTPEVFTPPIPDPRAQLIITQTMHQLSALVSTPWVPTHDPSFMPHTPSHRHQSSRASSIFNTPYHPHPYPYSFDPNLSIATLPPDSSPEPIFSPEKSLARASSRSRKRNVSFKIDRVSDRVSLVQNQVDHKIKERKRHSHSPEGSSRKS